MNDIEKINSSDTNKIAKTYENISIIDFVSNQLIDLKDMVNTILITTFETRTYVENLIEYEKCLHMLNQINEVLKSIIPKKNKED